MIEQTKTLVILSPGFPENETDTTCLPAHQVFVKALNRNFPEIKIIILAFQYPFSAASYKWFENDVISFGGYGKTKIQRVLLWMKIWWILKKIKKENELLGMLSFWCNEFAFVGKYFGVLNKIKLFIWITGQDARKNNPFVKLVKPKPRELFAMSDFLAKEFCKNYGILPASVIPNGIDTNLFSIEKAERDIDILGAGSLILLKQYDIFIEVVNEIAKKIPAIKTLICGKGDEENNLNRMIGEMKLQKNISLDGEKKHADVLRIMQRSKVFLHTSEYEGFSTVCLEALYAGAHVISFCRPMEKQTIHWHIAESKNEMIEIALEILQNEDTEYFSVLDYSMDDTAKKVMQLFSL